MKVIFTEAASRDLDEILLYLTNEHPAQADGVAQRIDAVLISPIGRKTPDPSRNGVGFV
jgi:plasmid stabilization system protein ParE